MEETQFYVMENPNPKSPEDILGGTTAYLVEGAHLGDAPRCPKCGRYIGPRSWLPPFLVELEKWGKEFGDVVQVGALDMLVSQRFKDCFDTSRLSGLLGFEPVEVVRVKRYRRTPVDLPTYYKCSVVRSHTYIDQVSSGFKWQEDEPVCPVCLWQPSSCTLKAYRSLQIQSGSWTGEDIFYPRGSPVNRFVSSRFRDVCLTHQLRNMVFFPAANYAWHKRLGEP